ncbi:MAG: hypothetical protein AAB641_00380 [Patescibacteria group bacterium]
MSNINQKAERLASALYLITGFFNDQEPLKWKLRALAADFVVSERIKDKSIISREALSLLSLAKNSALISETNHAIVSGELLKFGQESEKYLDDSFFKESRADERALVQSAKLELIKDKNIEEKLSYLPPESKSELKEKTLKEFGAVSVKRNSRQSTIIGLLKRKKEIMIKDVSPLISGCSEKTIQRELLAMVAAGILRKIGEKRWSRYSLA